MTTVSRSRRLRSSARDLVFRARRKAVAKWSDPELQQLRALTKAYGSPGGPDLLIFGDSAMFWSEYGDEDRSTLFDLVEERLGVSTEVLMGPGYNPRIVMAYLGALAPLPFRPRAILVPTSVLMSTSIWLSHPQYGYEKKSAELVEVIAGRTAPKRLEEPPAADYEDFDRLPAPSLFGARRTVGELRLITNSPPLTRWQTAIRTRHLMDFHNAETLNHESPGVDLIRQMGRAIEDLGVPTASYISPINHDLLKATLGAGAVEHMLNNVTFIERAFAESASTWGSVINGSSACVGGDFADPLHLNEHGRLVFAEQIAGHVSALLERAT